MTTSNRKDVAILSLALVVVTLGFGMIIPIFPFYIEKLGAGGRDMGLLIATAALFEFLFAPLWGSISDRTGRKPILMIGMDSAERKLGRYRHLFYRMKSHVMRFLPLNEQDVRSFADQVCEVRLADSAISEIYKTTGGRLGDIIAEIYKAERIAAANDFSTIEKKHLLIRRAA